jgi:hypothetical protein
MNLVLLNLPNYALLPYCCYSFCTTYHILCVSLTALFHLLSGFLSSTCIRPAEGERSNEVYRSTRTSVEIVVMYHFHVEVKVSSVWELLSALSIDPETTKI